MVAMAEMERAVTEVTVTDIRIMRQVRTEIKMKKVGESSYLF